MAERQEDNDRILESINDVAVMIVDDDVLITRLVTRALNGIGISNVYAMNDPQQALDFVAEGLDGIDLILCDLMMPEIDGLTILKHVREAKTTLPFVMMTADGTSESVRQAVDLRVTGYVVKPFGIDELLEKVRQTLIRAYGPKAGRPPRIGE